MVYARFPEAGGKIALRLGCYSVENKIPPDCNNLSQNPAREGERLPDSKAAWGRARLGKRTARSTPQPRVGPVK